MLVDSKRSSGNWAASKKLGERRCSSRWCWLVSTDSALTVPYTFAVGRPTAAAFGAGVASTLSLAAELDAHLPPRHVERALARGRLQRSELDEQPVRLGSLRAQRGM